MKRITLFSQQTIGLGARKTSMVFLAQAFRELGYDVCFVTTQLSWLSKLNGGSRLSSVPPSHRNTWFSADGMQAYVWVPPLHPVSASSSIARKVTWPLVDLYGSLLPRDLKQVVKTSGIVMIESCAAVALVKALKRAAPDASFVYSMSDRLDAVGMHPRLQIYLQRNTHLFDLIRVPARALAEDFGSDNVAYIPHGLQKEVFDRPSDSPYSSGANAVLIGDMMLDQPLLQRLVRAFPSVSFHYFGRTPLRFQGEPNLTSWGEQPFDRLVPYIQHADVGLALYEQHAGLEYLAESSLKNAQYAYCGLPVVGPEFIRNDRMRLFGYQPADPTGAEQAMAGALAAGRSASKPDIMNWTEVAGEILTQLERRQHASTQSQKSAASSR